MTKDQYDRMNKYRDVINHFNLSGHYPGGDSKDHINAILMELGWPSMSGWCSACVADRLKAAYNIINEYEQKNGKL